MELKKFTKAEAAGMRLDIDNALKIVAEKYGAVLDIGNIQYGAHLDVKISFSKITEGIFGKYAQTKESIAFEQKVWKHKIPLDALNQTFTHKGEEITITGYNSRARRYPITYTKDGRSFKASASFVMKIVTESLPSVLL